MLPIKESALLNLATNLIEKMLTHFKAMVLQADTQGCSPFDDISIMGEEILEETLQKNDLPELPLWAFYIRMQRLLAYSFLMKNSRDFKLQDHFKTTLLLQKEFLFDLESLDEALRQHLFTHPIGIASLFFCLMSITLLPFDPKTGTLVSSLEKYFGSM